MFDISSSDVASQIDVRAEAYNKLVDRMIEAEIPIILLLDLIKAIEELEKVTHKSQQKSQQ